MYFFVVKKREGKEEEIEPIKICITTYNNTVTGTTFTIDMDKTSIKL
jgi:hypothetical protein